MANRQRGCISTESGSGRSHTVQVCLRRSFVCLLRSFGGGSAQAALWLAAASVLMTACGGGAGSAPPPPPPGAIAPGQSIGSGSISGRVVLTTPPPPRQKLNISESACRMGESEPPLSETVVANADNTLRNVIVYVKTGLGDRVFAPPAPAMLDQKGCVYTPHVIAVMTNQIVTFVNSDPTLHNVHAVAKVNSPFNVGMGVQGQKVTRFFSKPEFVKVKCDVHSWMQSYIGVSDNPFHAVTGEGGAFTLSGLPAGTYEIEAWQENYGAKSQQVTLGDGESKSIEFQFGG